MEDVLTGDSGILSFIGGTPLIELRRLFAHREFSVHAKLDGFNPAGSSKDRPALEIIRQGIKSGAISKDTVIVESSSGNMGVGLAMVCRCYGLRFICVVDPRTNMANRQLMQAYGAEVDLVPEPDPETGDFLRARLNRVQYLTETLENTHWPNQYNHLGNAHAHFSTTVPEIMDELGTVDYLFCAAGTCGTFRGSGEYIKQNELPTRLIAVDAYGSVIFGLEPAKRLLPGMGAAIRPPLCDPTLAHGVVHVSDEECVVGCRRLVRHEAILAGGSAGGVITAIEKMADEIPAGSTCAVILSDRGDRYLETVYNDAWVQEHFGEISGSWELDSTPLQSAETVICSQMSS